MTGHDTGASAFLQQAHRNNWQVYLASLRPGARRGWDACVLTASDDRQVAMYRRQIDWRRAAGLLPGGMRFDVVADPGGQRIGSGGATLRVLQALADGRAEALGTQRVLLIHSGGDSKRLPHASATGKLFARVPRVLPDGRASTIFDEFLIGLSGLAADLPPGVLVASGDVLLVFDPLQISFRRRGAVGVAAAAPAEMGTHHGVYVSAPDGHRVRAYLHKPPAAAMAQWGADDGDGMVQIDTGLVWLDAETAARFAGLMDEQAVAGLDGPLNLYGDLLLPMAQSTALDAYLADESDGPATPALQTARRAIWDRLRGMNLTVERLQPAVFVHFGTSSEYLHMAADPGLGRMCGWVTCAAAWPHTTDHGPQTTDHGDSLPSSIVRRPSSVVHHRLVLVNAVLEGSVAVGDGPVLVVDSHLGGPVVCRGEALVAGVDTTQALDLADGAVMHQLPVEGGFVTRVFGLGDDPKRGWDDAAATVMNRPWNAWLAGSGITPEALWPGVPPGERTLWNALLYPVAADREESLRLALPLQHPANAPGDWRERWRAALRLSLAEGFAWADGDRLLADVAEVEDAVACRYFRAAVGEERSAEEIKLLMGTDAGAVRRRARQAARDLAGAPPVLRLRGYKALAVAAGDASWEDRAFAVLAEMVEAAVRAARPAPSADVRTGPVVGAVGKPTRVAAAARIDFGGGWTDTPPYSVERGGCVLNAAVTLRGAHPIVAEGEWLTQPRLVLECEDIDDVLQPARAGEVLRYSDPADPFALHKAALVLRGIVPADCDPDTPMAEVLKAGLRLRTQTHIPRGSGLGTSSIMAGVVLACLGRMAGEDLSEARLFDEVLCVEQMMTTGGGWQDQAGGLTGGIKLVTTQPGLPQRIRVQALDLTEDTAAELAARLLLVYTGQTRLAKNLLRTVVGRWMARDPDMVWILEEIARLAVAMQGALAAGDIDGFGELLTAHWALNKRIDPGCTNPFIDTLFEAMTPYICGGKLAGAGGGGFAIVVARDPKAAQDLTGVLRMQYPGTPVAVWECGIPERGMRIS